MYKEEREELDRKAQDPCPSSWTSNPEYLQTITCLIFSEKSRKKTHT